MPLLILALVELPLSHGMEARLMAKRVFIDPVVQKLISHSLCSLVSGYVLACALKAQRSLVPAPSGSWGIT